MTSSNERSGSLSAALASAHPMLHAQQQKPHLPRNMTKNYEHRPHKGLLRSMVSITNEGAVTTVNMDRTAVMRTTSVPARDLRLLDPRSQSPASILIRERALVLVLDKIRAIITHDQLLVVTKQTHTALGSEVAIGKEHYGSNGRHNVAAAFLNALHNRLTGSSANSEQAPDETTAGTTGRLSRFSSSNNLAELGSCIDVASALDGTSSNRDGDGESTKREEDTQRRKGPENLQRPGSENEDLPFEFLVLEIALEVTCNSLEYETLELDALGRRAVDALATKVTTTRLEQVRKVKGLISRLLTRVSQLKEELSHLLDDDDDMRQMYLTRKNVQQMLLNSQNDTRALAAISPDAASGRGGGLDESVVGRRPETPLPNAGETNGGITPSVVVPHLPVLSPAQRSVTAGRRFNARSFGSPFGSSPMDGLGGSVDDEIANDFDDMEELLETFHEAISGTHARLISVRPLALAPFARLRRTLVYSSPR